MSEEINPEAGNEAESDVSSEQEQVVDADTSPAREGMGAEKVRGIVEAILMTSDSPVTPGKLQALIKGVNGRDLRQAVDDLNESYREGGHAMSITEVAGGFQVVTRKEFGPWVRKFHDHSQIRLSQAALETLSIVAFKQPVTRIEVDSVRGVDSGGVLRTLMELNMIRLVGRSEGVGRPHLFGTTRDFMTHFGLRSLADLPKPRELEELLAEGERKAQENGTALAPSSPPEDGLPIEGEAVELSPDDDADESESADGVADVDWDDDADATDDPAPDDDRR
ncbi:MAG TPA: SMC-Scp complex subunit ScpB [Candidatus Latescibacteria bacterium]|nr:SMC-Scp complex subunit ScpB [Candidatus Latescibacterota bacterium]